MRHKNYDTVNIDFGPTCIFKIPVLFIKIKNVPKKVSPRLEYTVIAEYDAQTISLNETLTETNVLFIPTGLFSFLFWFLLFQQERLGSLRFATHIYIK